MSDFLSFLSSIDKPLLIAHNAAFDRRIIIRNLIKENLLEAFEKVTVGFCDTLQVFKAKYPDRKSYKQVDLVSDLGKATYEAHNAIADVTSLQSLVASHVTQTEIQTHSMHISTAIQLQEFLSIKSDNLLSFQPVISNMKISKYLASRIAEAGLAYCHVRLAFQRAGSDGLRDLLQEHLGYLPKTCALANLSEHHASLK